MEQTITTIHFDGQFWTALIEKIDHDGAVCIGRYVFGAEPSNARLREFYLHEYIYVPVYQSEVRVRLKKRVSIREQKRTVNKSRKAYASAQKSYMEEKSSPRRAAAGKKTSNKTRKIRN